MADTDTLSDVRYGFRILIKNPAFSFFALIAMTLGIGAGTAIFSIADAVLIRPLPYPRSERLVTIWETEPEVHWAPATFQDFLEWRRQNSVFADLSAYELAALTLNGVQNPQRLLTARVSPELFRELGIPPMMGLTLEPPDDRPASGPAAVISERLWRTHFGSDPNVVGRSINLSRNLYTIVGIMPARFQSPRKNTDVWIPLVAEAELAKSPSHYLRVIARLKDGIGTETAQAEMNVIARRLAAQFPESNTGVGARIVPLLDILHEEIGPMLRIMSVGAGLLLLIACVNVSGLLLARTVNRQQEISLRLAVGASRLRLVRQLLIESVILAVTGGLGGVLAAPWLVRWLLALFPERIASYVPNLENAGVDGRVLAVAILAAAISGVLFGLVPAWKASRLDIHGHLKTVSFRNTGSRVHNRTHRILVATEFAVSLILLIAAGLLFRSFVLLERRELGFAPDHVLTFSVSLPEAAYPTDREVAAFYRKLIEQLQAIRGVRFAAAVSNLPLGGSNTDTEIRIPGAPPPPVGEETLSQYSAATPGYFQAMGIPLLQGRGFDAADEEGRSRAAVIGESTARRFFPRGDALGKRILLGAEHEPVQVVGIVRDVRWHEFDNESVTNLYVYVPCAQEPPRDLTLVLRTSVPVEQVAAKVRSAVSRIDPEQAISRLSTMEEVVSRANAPRRFNMLLMGAFAFFALLLASAGVYGTAAHSVSSRKRELGIRLALGASRSTILRRLLGEGLRLAAFGVAAGLAGAILLSRAIASLLYGVKAADPLTIGGSVAILLFTSVLASAIPALHALRYEPAEILRD